MPTAARLSHENDEWGAPLLVPRDTERKGGDAYCRAVAPRISWSLRGLTCSIPERYVVSPVVLMMSEGAPFLCLETLKERAVMPTAARSGTGVFPENLT